MLRKTFEETQRDIAKILSQRDYQTGETWHDFCRKRDFTMGEMLEGHEMMERVKERLRNSTRQP